MMVPERIFLSANLYTSESLLACSSIRAINNDTGIELPCASYTLQPQYLESNKVWIFFHM
jgi:hypothetical protein